MKTLTKIAIAIGLLSASAFGQTVLSTTTLGAAITSTTSTSITLTSTSTMQTKGANGQVNTCFYVDKELFGVDTVVSSTVVTVQQRGRGCGALGASSHPTTHLSGAKVYFAITATSGSVTTLASTLIGRNQDYTAQNYGSCTSTTELALPRIYIFSGDIFQCYRTGAAATTGQWVKISNGTSGNAGQRISGFCTGTVGSAETAYLNGAACSGATTATARQLVTAPGVLANLYVVSSANFLGTGGTATTVYKNGSATAITCSAAAAATTCSDTTHEVAVVPGDVITFQNVSATSDTAANVAAAVSLY